MKKTSIVVLGSLLIWQACKHDIPTMPDKDPVKDTSQVLTPLSIDSVCDLNKVYFVNDVQPILLSSCAYSGCHNANTKSDGIDLSSYDAMINSGEPGDDSKLIVANEPDKSELYEAIEDDKMPLGGPALSADAKKIIRDWISQGAQYNECITSDTCDTTNVSFSTDVQPVLNTYCIGCHSGASANKGVELTDYAKVNTHVTSGKLKDALLGQNGVSVMPPSSSLSTCDLNKLLKWIDDGAPNN